MKERLIQVCEVAYYNGNLHKIKYINIFYIDEHSSKDRYAEFQILKPNTVCTYETHRIPLYNALEEASRHTKNEKLHLSVSLNLPRDGILFKIGDNPVSDQAELIRSYISNRDYYSKYNDYITKGVWINCMRAIDTYHREKTMLSWGNVEEYAKRSQKKIEEAGYEVVENFYVVKTFFG